MGWPLLVNRMPGRETLTYGKRLGGFGVGKEVERLVVVKT